VSDLRPGARFAALSLAATLLPARALPVSASPADSASGPEAALSALAPVERAVRELPAAAELSSQEWPHRALRELIRAGGCGGSALGDLLDAAVPINRDEAALLLQACLANPELVGTEPLLRLQGEFAPELARLQGRVDGLEARLAELDATRFSPTTSLRGDVRWWLGGVGYGGNQINRAANSYGGQPLRDAFVYNYDVRFSFTTSFDGQDLLRLRLRSGNGGFSGFRSDVAPTLRLSGLSPGCSVQRPEACRNDLLQLDKFFYQRPLGPNWRVTLGSRVNQKDMIAIWPAAFDDNEILLSLFSKGGAPGAYSDVKGAGLGFYWTQRTDADAGVGWVVSAVTVAGAPASGDPAEGGLFSAGSRGASSLQLGYQAGSWAAAAIYTLNQAGALDRAGLTPLAAETWPSSQPGLGGHVHAFALTGFWVPLRSGWFPALTLGAGFNRADYSGEDGTVGGRRPPQLAESQSWMVGLNWYDVLVSGSELAFAIGSPVSVSRYRNAEGQQGAADRSLQMELWYRLQPTDWLTITPGVFWLPRPRGQLTAAGTAWDSTPLPLGQGASFSAFGAVLKLRFRF
jgi:hypothetical protein